MVRPGAWSARCSCSAGTSCSFEQDLVGAAHGDHGFLHAVLHALDDGGHAHQAGDAENDAQHRQQRAELVRPDFLEADQDGVGEGHVGYS